MDELTSRVIDLIGVVIKQNHILQHTNNKLDLLLAQGEKMEQEVVDLNAKLDAQTEAITAFNTNLQQATDAISTEIKQLADTVQTATSLAEVKAAVANAAARVQGNTDAIQTASSTLQTQVDSLKADDPTAPPSEPSA